MSPATTTRSTRSTAAEPVRVVLVVNEAVDEAVDEEVRSPRELTPPRARFPLPLAQPDRIRAPYPPHQRRSRPPRTPPRTTPPPSTPSRPSMPPRPSTPPPPSTPPRGTSRTFTSRRRATRTRPRPTPAPPPRPSSTRPSPRSRRSTSTPPSPSRPSTSTTTHPSACQSPLNLTPPRAAAAAVGPHHWTLPLANTTCSTDDTRRRCAPFRWEARGT